MNKRLLSVDVFRGMTIMLMTVVNNPGTWSHIYPPLRHAEWHGVTPTDWVFPFFLFIMGVAVPLASPSREWSDDVMGKILIRTFRIFSLGLFLAFFSKIQFFGWQGVPLLAVRLFFTVITFMVLLGKYDKKVQFYGSLLYLSVLFILAYGGFESFQNVRIPGVLQRIAIVYFAVSLLYFRTPTWVQLVLAVVILLSYWLLMCFVPVGDIPVGSLEPGVNAAAWFDLKFLKGHMWASTETWDPEGIASTLPAIVTGIFGVLTGKLLLNTHVSQRSAFYMIAAGLGSLLIAMVWSTYFPINKALWTSTFVLYTAGVALIILGVLHIVTETLSLKSWTKPFLIFGINPMLVFFASGIIPRALGMITWNDKSIRNHIYDGLIVPLFEDPRAASLTGALVYLIIWFLILSFFYRKKMIFKV